MVLNREDCHTLRKVRCSQGYVLRRWQQQNTRVYLRSRVYPRDGNSKRRRCRAGEVIGLFECRR